MTAFDRKIYDGFCATDRGEHLAERSLIGRLLVKPDEIPAAKSRIKSHQLADELNRNILDAIYGIHDDGQKPTWGTIVGTWGDYECHGQLNLSTYLRGMGQDALCEIAQPIDATIDFLLDKSRKVEMYEVATSVQSSLAAGHEGAIEAGRSAIDKINSILSEVGAGERKLLSGADLAIRGIEMLEGKARTGPETGFRDLDDVIIGWPMAQLSIVAGRPGMGKSAFAVSALLNAAKAGANALMFSLEMTGEQLGSRMIADLAFTQIDPLQYRSRRTGLSSRHRSLADKAIERLQGLPVRVCDRSGMTVEDIATHARMYALELKQAGKTLDLVMVDHIGLVVPSGTYRGQRVHEVAETAHGLADIAKRLEVPVVGLCQLNRAVEGRENKRPTMADLRDSGAIEEDASLILSLYRPAYYLEKERYDDAGDEAARIEALKAVRNKLEVNIEKNRNAHTVRVDLFVDMGANAIRNASFGGAR